MKSYYIGRIGKTSSLNLEINGEVANFRFRPLYISGMMLHAYLIGAGWAPELAWMMWNPTEGRAPPGNITALRVQNSFRLQTELSDPSIKFVW